MRIAVISIFPEMLRAITDFGVTRRAVRNGLIEIHCINPRDYAYDKHQKVDERPFGGGPGMLMMVQPLRDAILKAKELLPDAAVVYLSPQGRVFSHSAAVNMARREEIIFLCGRYEGIDERFISKYIDEEISLGDYVLSGGELPSMVLIDAVSRLIPGVLGDYSSAEQDSFYDEILDYPQYTRPESIEGMDVPEVLLSGNHESIRRWRLSQSLGKTFTKRPDLLKTLALTDEQEEFLAKYIQSNDCQK